MPTRIKPLQKLAPCILTLESLQKITELVETSFPNTTDTITFSASDDIWEIYGEQRDSFLDEIANRQKLDSFVVEVKSQGAIEKLNMVFDEKEATVLFIANPQKASWFEHFMIDLRKYLLTSSFDSRLAFLVITFNPSVKIPTPYCKIVIQQKPPSPFIENIKANIVSNIIWVILVFVFGILSTIVAQNYLGK